MANANRYKYDLHIHTNHSDGVMSVEQAVETAKNKGLTGMAITDHDTIDGLKDAQKACKKHGLLFIPGLEITTPGGDILALNANKKIIFNGSYEKIIEDIHKNGGIAILAHPFAGHLPDPITDKEDVLEMLDAIEVFNSNTNLPANMMAIEFAKQIGKPGFAASDAHRPDEISKAFIGSSATDAAGLMSAIKKGQVVIGIG